VAAIDLCTLAEVNEFLQTPAGDTEQDVIIGKLVTRASELILNYCEREFAPPTTAAARDFVWFDGLSVDLAPYDLRTATSVVLRSDRPAAEQTTLTTSDYRLRPKPAKDGVYQRIQLRNYSLADFPADPQVEVRVTGDWGFSAVPDDVRDACIKTVGIWLRRDVAPFTETFNLDEQRLERPRALPRPIQDELDHYRRFAIA
jgi:hypothetical protein